MLLLLLRNRLNFERFKSFQAHQKNFIKIRKKLKRFNKTKVHARNDLKFGFINGFSF